ncbi:protein SUPPRESSOR OF MAX2 1-like [Andrographis paniculata]|uniref:protein SUPPRESSOR OF MAX2 1-like n=1 Tax=Andrographis paniculata TaxID=175694 RepID=UPI0021E762B5|nr:protein SUPPRESSOR OF MAX2 1-like [Andrographis paniculata]
MRAALSTIQQTLTPEAASVLNHSIAEAARRNHGQTTPLHVAATLLASPSGFLRQACIRSHPNSSHPLQCRALELCFTVALDRLPTAQSATAPATEPPISNALLAALKRAQAHQRRGCPEQQQQPLLAVKVELEQLIISILDDPSVSRVMREASFSSPAVKATIEQSLSSSNPNPNPNPNPLLHHQSTFGSNLGSIGPRVLSNSGQLSIPPPTVAAPSPSPSIPLPNRNPYLNPRLQQIGNNPKIEESKKLLEIMLRAKKRNPILVGDSDPTAVVKDFLRKLENKELGGSSELLKNVHIISMDKGDLSDKNQIPARISDLSETIADGIRIGAVVLDLGDLKWLVEQPKPQVVSEAGRAAVVEVMKLLSRFDGGATGDGGNKLWLIGAATCETYLRCQVYHSTMEADWDLQALPVAPRSPLAGAFPRLGAERLLSNPVESSFLNPLKPVTSTLPVLSLSENSDPSQRPLNFCPQCHENYQKELAKLSAIEKSFSDAKQDSSRPTSLPPWLQSAKLDTTNAASQGKDQGVLSKQKTQELQKKWRDTCLHLHPNFHQNTRPGRPGPPSLSMTSLYNPALLSHPPFRPKMPTSKPLGEALQLNMNSGGRTAKPLGEALQLNMNTVERMRSPPGSPVKTDLVLGMKGSETVLDKTTTENQAKDFLGCISSEPQTKLIEKFSNALDADTYKKLLKGLMEKAWWQAEAASAVASAITRCRLDSGKRRGGGSRGDVWLLFTGPDRVGKKKMASVLAEQICGTSPVIICLGRRRDDEESDMNFRGKTAIDRIAEAVRRNPFSVIMLEDIDEADVLVRGSIKSGIERGRLTDFYGREVGLGNAIFIITGDWSTTSPEALRDGHFVDEMKLAAVANGDWQLGLIVREKNGKRRASWLNSGDDRPSKARNGPVSSGLSLDLNLATGYTEDDKTDGSHNSSDLTVDHEDELSLVNRHFSITSVPHDLVSSVDESIVFKPVESGFVRNEIKKTISVRFSMAVDDTLSIEVEDDVVDKILGGLWHDRTSLEEWIENVLSPSFDQVKTQLASTRDPGGSVVRLVVESESCSRGKRKDNADWLPRSILV